MESPLAFSDTLQAPVHRLNADSLAMIFYQAVRDERSAYEEFTRLICVTHICRQWRDVALSLAELWGDVACACPMEPKAFAIVIGRARTALLRVPKGVYQLGTMQIAYILSQPQRFGELQSLECAWSSAILAGRSLPRLVAATLPVADGGGGSYPTQSPVYAPILQELSLVGCCIPLIAPSLKSLELAMRVPLQLDELSAMLDTLPTLSSLTLRDALPEDRIGTDVLGRIKLPSLRRMHLVDSCLSLETFLQHFRPTNPDAALVTIHIRHADRTADLLRLFRTLQPYLGCSSNDTVLINPQNLHFFLAYRHSHMGNCDKRWPVRGVSLHSDSFLSDFRIFYAALIEQFAVSQIRLLTIHSLEYTANTFFSNFSTPDVLQLLRMPQLAASVQTLEHILATNREQDDPQVVASIISPFFQFDSPTPWPQLTELTLAGDWPLFLHTLPDGVACVQSWLERRAAAGCPLRILRLRRIVTETDDNEPKYNDEGWNRIRALVSVEIEETI